MKMLSVAVDESFANAIDRMISSSKIYSSRSEFLKDSMRKNLAEMMVVSEDLKIIRRESEKFFKIARQRGYKGGLLTRKEKAEIAREFIKGIKIT
ncbi:MAG: hypothetical protein NUV57_05820 [archaeon]|nr:hypothetical protein [archaeon]